MGTLTNEQTTCLNEEEREILRDVILYVPMQNLLRESSKTHHVQQFIAEGKMKESKLRKNQIYSHTIKEKFESSHLGNSTSYFIIHLTLTISPAKSFLLYHK